MVTDKKDPEIFFCFNPVRFNSADVGVLEYRR